MVFTLACVISLKCHEMHNNCILCLGAYCSMYDFWSPNTISRIILQSFSVKTNIITILNYYQSVWHSPILSKTQNITKTCLYNFDPLKPHFYIVKLGFTGVYIIFLISAQNIGCGYSLEPPRRGSSNEFPQSMF